MDKLWLPHIQFKMAKIALCLIILESIENSRIILKFVHINKELDLFHFASN